MTATLELGVPGTATADAGTRPTAGWHRICAVEDLELVLG